jgi:bifunctional DNase/RNase
MAKRRTVFTGQRVFRELAGILKNLILRRPVSVYFSYMLIPVEIASFAIQADNNSPLVILKEAGGDRTIAVPIGPFEASAIAIQSLNVVSEKPLTIDLVKLMLDALSGAIDKVVIKGPLGDPFARLHVIVGGRMRVIECRCGDAIALAMRCSTRILADEKIFGKNLGMSGLEEAEKLKAAIAGIDTTNFGKYYL